MPVGSGAERVCSITRSWAGCNKRPNRIVGAWRMGGVASSSRARLASDPDLKADDATIVLMQLVGPPRKAVARRRSVRKASGHGEGDLPELELDEGVPRP